MVANGERIPMMELGWNRLPFAMQVSVFAVESGFYFDWKCNTLVKIHRECKITWTSMKHNYADEF